MLGLPGFKRAADRGPEERDAAHAIVEGGDARRVDRREEVNLDDGPAVIFDCRRLPSTATPLYKY